MKLLLLLSSVFLLSAAAQDYVPALLASKHAAVNATFVSSAQAETASANTIGPTGLSIPAGDLIMVLTVATHVANIVNPTDSNSDIASCDTGVEDSNAIGTLLCVIKAGATVTSVTCSQGANTNPLACVITWYTSGTLGGIQDQSASQAQNNILNWSSGATGTLTGSNDLVVDAWSSGNATITSTYSDSTTSRIICSSQYACAISDRNVSGTSAVTGTGTWNTTTFGQAHVMAVD